MKKKTFDAVKMMRDIREKLTQEFSSTSQAEDEALEKINQKYGIKAQSEISTQ